MTTKRRTARGRADVHVAVDPTCEGTTRSTDFRAKRSGCGGPPAGLSDLY